MAAISTTTMQNIRIQLNNFPFAKITNAASIDYEMIKKIVDEFARFASYPIFGENINNCVVASVDFAIYQSAFLMKHGDSKDLLLDLIDLLIAILKRLRGNSTTFAFIEQRRLLTLINNYFKNSYFNIVKIEAGNLLAEFLLCAQLNDLLIETLYCAFQTLQKCAAATAPLARICCAVLEKNISLDFVYNWLMQNLPPELNNEPETVVELLKAAASLILNSRQLNNTDYIMMLVNKFTPILNLLCGALSNPNAREPSEIIISHVLTAASSKAFTDWELNETDMLKKIKNLPNDLQLWIHQPEIFFICAYLLELHSNNIWTDKEVLRGIDVYLKTPQRPSDFILKTLLLLYPIAISKKNNDAFKYDSLLKSFLETTKNLSIVITNHPTEIVWLMQGKNPFLKLRILNAWLEIEQEEGKIIDILEKANCTVFLLQILVCFPHDSSIARISKLVINLKENDVLKKVLSRAFPLVCKDVQIFENLIQLQPSIPNDPMEVFNLLKIVSASLPFLKNTKSIASACSYASNLLNVVKKEPNAVKIFYQQGVSIRFLIQEVSTFEHEESSLNAITLMTILLKIQIATNTLTPNHPVDFTKIINGSNAKVAASLRFFSLTLTVTDKLFVIAKKDKLRTYHFLHNFLCKDLSEKAFKALRFYLKIEHGLAASSVTSFALKSVFRVIGMEIGDEMKKFLIYWLQILVHVPNYCVPKMQIKEWAYLLTKADQMVVKELLDQLQDW